VILGLVLGAVALSGSWYAWERSHRRTRAMPGGLRSEITLPHRREWELYHNALSLCSKKVRVCLAELGIAYESHHIDLIETGSYENISRHFLAVNPAGLVPVLVHDGHPIYESHDQIAYAAAHSRNGPSLVPESAEARARMQQWVDKASLFGDDPTADLATSAGNCVPGLTVPLFAAMMQDIGYGKILEGLLFHRLKRRPLMFGLMKASGLGRVAQNAQARRVIERSRDRMCAHLDDLERELATRGGPWILGDPYSLADVSWIVILERLREAAWLATYVNDARPHIAAYWQRLQARPSYGIAITDVTHPTIARGTRRIVEEKARNAALRALYESRSSAT
jgi:glutathione S-transferase